MVLRNLLRFHPRRFIHMSQVPSIFNQNLQNSLTSDNARIQWCIEECKKCSSLVTMKVLAQDKPCFLKCMVCDEMYFYTENDLKERHLL